MRSNHPLTITVLPGDGIGQEVMQAATPVFEALKVPVRLLWGDIGWFCWQNEGTPIPTRTWQLISQSDTTLLGAITSKPQREAEKERRKDCIGSPEYVSPVIQLRQQLDLYVNVRPCFDPNNTNRFRFTIVRDNSEGLYAGFDYHPIPNVLYDLIRTKPHWRGMEQDAISATLRLQSQKGLERLFQFGFAYAKANGYTRVTFADKPNVLRYSSAFAREQFETIAANYPEITADIVNVDALALWLIKRPEKFGVIVAENMFGDILSDLGAGVMGGLGLAPSANIGEKGSYFEPVHGSAPQVKSNTANPIAMFLTIGLLLEHFGEYHASKTITAAVQAVIQDNRYVTYDLGGTASTQDAANAILDKIERFL